MRPFNRRQSDIAVRIANGTITLYLSDIDSFRATPLPSLHVAYQFLSSEGRENINTSITLKGIKNYLKEAKTGKFKENEVTKLQKAEMPLSSLTSGGSPEYKGRRYEPPMTYPSLKTWTAVHAYGMKTITKNSSPNIWSRKETNDAIALSLLSKIVFTYRIFTTLSVICYWNEAVAAIFHVSWFFATLLLHQLSGEICRLYQAW